MAAESTKNILKQLRADSPLIRANDRKYKEHYSETMWALVEQIVEENERMHKQFATMESMVSVVKNQAELITHESREARKSVDSQLEKMKALAHYASSDSSNPDADKAEDAETKGK
jgi:hypothetical protein